MVEDELSIIERIHGVEEFLSDYPGMAIKPATLSKLVLKGVFSFTATTKNKIIVTDSYRLDIKVPFNFPHDLPDVSEIDNKIPQEPEYHVNPDGTLCLGSPLRQLWLIAKKPTMTGFAENCIVPYLYSISYKLKHGGELPWGDLDHGLPGERSDYIDLLGVKTIAQVIYVLKLLGMKKRRANKKMCPCGCGKRVGVCRYNYKLKEFRGLAGRPWFRSRLP